MVSIQEQEQYIAANNREFGDDAATLNWITPAQAANSTDHRNRLLAPLAGRISSCCNGAKLFTGTLSPGCRQCTEGAWSCLFINGICNGHCFYCPTSQTSKGVPTTNTLQFPIVRDYNEYLKVFQIRGVGISGGEPLLTFDRTLQYLEKIKLKFGPELHVWMYTNGMLLTAEKLKRLKAAGLDEIRFDISADGYNLDKAGMAVGEIASVTVEIPAIPEDAAILKEKIVEMSGLGVGYLNLHQLRCTLHNREKLAARPYTFVHGPKITVLESELTALEMLQFAVENQVRTSVNYCSFIYRHRYQNMGARRRAATAIRKPHETITATGHIRSLAVAGTTEQLTMLASQFQASGAAPELWTMTCNGKRLTVALELLPHIDLDLFSLYLTYHSAVLKSAVSYQNTYREIPLGHGRKLVAERRQVSDELEIDQELAKALQAESTTAAAQSLIDQAKKTGIDASKLEEIRQWEEQDAGLADYF